VPGTGQDLQEVVSYCQSGAFSSLSVSAVTGAETVGAPTATATAGTTGTTGTTAAGTTTGTSSSTAEATGVQHSSGSRTVVEMGFVGLVMMLGAAML